MQRLLWQKVLTKTDAQRQKGNPTGDLRLTSANFLIGGKSINHTKYFRFDIFENEEWAIIDEKSMKESCQIKFHVSVDNGRFEGKTHLTVAHKPSGEAGQKNYTTGIRWGVWLSHILMRELDCTGMIVCLKLEQGNYLLEINHSTSL